MVNISMAVRGHYGNDGYLWAIIIRRFCDTGHDDLTRSVPRAPSHVLRATC
jgi:hypothetical protein